MFQNYHFFCPIKKFFDSSYYVKGFPTCFQHVDKIFTKFTRAFTKYDNFITQA